MGCGIWGWCLMFSLSQSPSSFRLDGYPGLRGVRLEGRELERNARLSLLLWLHMPCPHLSLGTPEIIGRPL